jgi:hypothetical protein
VISALERFKRSPARRFCQQLGFGELGGVESGAGERVVGRIPRLPNLERLDAFFGLQQLSLHRQVQQLATGFAKNTATTPASSLSDPSLMLLLMTFAGLDSCEVPGRKTRGDLANL